jgi:hypothetical protein
MLLGSGRISGNHAMYKIIHVQERTETETNTLDLDDM